MSYVLQTQWNWKIVFASYLGHIANRRLLGEPRQTRSAMHGAPHESARWQSDHLGACPDDSQGPLCDTPSAAHRACCLVQRRGWRRGSSFCHRRSRRGCDLRAANPRLQAVLRAARRRRPARARDPDGNLLGQPLRPCLSACLKSTGRGAPSLQEGGVTEPTT